MLCLTDFQQRLDVLVTQEIFLGRNRLFKEFGLLEDDWMRTMLGYFVKKERIYSFNEVSEEHDRNSLLLNASVTNPAKRRCEQINTFSISSLLYRQGEKSMCRRSC